MSEKRWPSFSFYKAPLHSEPWGGESPETRRGRGTICKIPLRICLLIMVSLILISIILASVLSKELHFVSAAPTSTLTTAANIVSSRSTQSTSTSTSKSISSTQSAPHNQLVTADTLLPSSFPGTASATEKPLVVATTLVSVTASKSATTLITATTLNLAISPTTALLSTSTSISASVVRIVAPELLLASTVAPPSCSASHPPPTSAGKVLLSGINIAGCDFGMDTNGNQEIASATCPIGPTYTRPDGPGQMIHFASEGFNIFRLPVGWQFLINSSTVASGTLNPTNFAKYNFLVQSCLATGAYCLVDVHNYARFNGSIIGQGGPTDTVFTQLWTSLATQYKNQRNVIFGVMNEPHDLPSLATWGATVQKAVTAIRNTGATSQVILLPGTDYSSALSLAAKSMPYLWNITNPDGTYTNLVFDIHKYIDATAAGIVSTCVDTSVVSTWASLTQWLRCHGRMALLTETGGGSTPSCDTYLCQLIDYLHQNSDVYLGYLGWAAGSFSLTYPLSLTPSVTNGVYTDSQILTQCLLPN